MLEEEVKPKKIIWTGESNRAKEVNQYEMEAHNITEEVKKK